MGAVGKVVSTVAVTFTVAYVGYMAFFVAQLFYPTWSLYPSSLSTAKYHKPYYASTQHFDLFVHICAGNAYAEADSIFRLRASCSEQAAWEVKNFRLDDVAKLEIERNVSIPKEHSSESVYAHAFLVAQGKSQNPTRKEADPLKSYVTTKLTRLARLQPRNVTRNLLKFANDREKSSGTVESSKESDLPIVLHWIPKLHIELVNDVNEYPSKNVPNDIPHRFVNVEDRPYLPILSSNDLGIQLKHLLPIEKKTVLPIKISLKSVHLGMFRFGNTMRHTLAHMSNPGAAIRMSEKEIDNLRQMFFETDPGLLAVTLLASIMHLLFDFLAFKSDIAHWKSKTTMKGVSKTSVLLSALGHAIATFYLWDKRQETSMLVIGGSLITTAVELWKVTRMIAHPPETNDEKITASIDSNASYYVTLFTVISVVTYSGWSLIFREHAGYWSFMLDTAMWSVYLLGFLTMTPQIFMNYRLKSVEAMPLRAFFFKAVNTFVDDLFAFVIPMPALTRMSVFRDDFIFILLCIQWWIYPTRKAAMEDESGDTTDAVGESSGVDQRKSLKYTSTDGTKQKLSKRKAGSGDN